jgi:broad specificity phosphatase PhoE
MTDSTTPTAAGRRLAAPRGPRTRSSRLRAVAASRRTGPTIVLVRHGETEWSAGGRHTSSTDVTLTEAGRRHAAALAARLAGRPLALVLVSPLARARETAALAGLGGRATVDEDLREFAYGDYEGLTTSHIHETRPDWDLWRDGAPGGETAEDVGARADRVIARALGAGGDVALFAHGHVLRVIAARWLQLPPARGGNFALDTGAVCELAFERERPAVWLWNDTSHL